MLGHSFDSCTSALLELAADSGGTCLRLLSRTRRTGDCTGCIALLESVQITLQNNAQKPVSWLLISCGRDVLLAWQECKIILLVTL